jgi:tetratricopeptide (TPR) repeat protein
MGGKPSRARQYLYLYIALVIFLGGCVWLNRSSAPPPPSPPTAAAPAPVVVPQPDVVVEPREVRQQREANEHLQLAQNFLARGDYEGSLRESRTVLALVKDQTPADTAVFNMGLVYANPKNPKKDNKQAIDFFNRVIKGYPNSPWVEQAKIWVSVLDGVEKMKQVDIDIEEKKRDRLR